MGEAKNNEHDSAYRTDGFYTKVGTSIYIFLCNEIDLYREDGIEAARSMVEIKKDGQVHVFRANVKGVQKYVHVLVPTKKDCPLICRVTDDDTIPEDYLN